MTKPKELKVGDRVRVLQHAIALPNGMVGSIVTITEVYDEENDCFAAFNGEDWFLYRTEVRKLPDSKEG